MAGELDVGVGEIAQDAGGEQQAPGQPGAQVAAEIDHEHPADGEVTEQVQPVGVQGERRDQAPPLAAQDQAAVGIADLYPVHRVPAHHCQIEVGQVVKGGEQDQDRQRGDGVLDHGAYRREDRRPVPVLLDEEPKLPAGGLQVLFRHQKLPPRLPHLYATLQVAGLEHQGPKPGTPLGEAGGVSGIDPVPGDRHPILFLVLGMFSFQIHGAQYVR